MEKKYSISRSEQLPPSLADKVRDRLHRYWETHNPMNGDTARTALEEFERVIRAMEGAGISQKTAETLRSVASVQAKAAGLSAMAINVISEGILVGYFSQPNSQGNRRLLTGIAGAYAVHRLAPADRLFRFISRVEGSVGEKAVQLAGSVTGAMK